MSELTDRLRACNDFDFAQTSDLIEEAADRIDYLNGLLVSAWKKAGDLEAQLEAAVDR